MDKAFLMDTHFFASTNELIGRPKVVSFWLHDPWAGIVGLDDTSD